MDDRSCYAKLASSISWNYADLTCVNWQALQEEFEVFGRIVTFSSLVRPVLVPHPLLSYFVFNWFFFFLAASFFFFFLMWQWCYISFKTWLGKLWQWKKWDGEKLSFSLLLVIVICDSVNWILLYGFKLVWMNEMNIKGFLSLLSFSR